MPTLPITDSCPTCLICGKKCHRMASHVRNSHNISKTEYLVLFPNAKMNSDERKAVQEEVNQKMSIIQNNNQILYGKEINEKISKSQLKRFENLSEEKRVLLSLKATERNKKRRNNKILDEQFKKKCSVASLKYWNNITSEQKQKRIDLLVNYWKSWYNSLSFNEQKNYRKNSVNKKQQLNTIVLGNKFYKFKSKFEKFVAEFLYIHNIKFEYEYLKIRYVHNNIIKNHIPDFYLPEFNSIIECKAFFKIHKNYNIEEAKLLQKDKEIAILNNNYKYFLILYERNTLSLLKKLYYILDNELKI